MNPQENARFKYDIVDTSKILRKRLDICKVCQKGDLKYVKLYYQQHSSKLLDGNKLLKYACTGGNLDTIDFLLSKVENINYEKCISGACRGGHLNLVKHFLSKIQSSKKSLNIWLFEACIGGNIDIVELMLSKGADYLNWAFEYACEGGNINIVRMLIQKGVISVTVGLDVACRHGYIDIVQEILHNFPPQKDLLEVIGRNNLDNPLKSACIMRHEKIIKLLISTGAKLCNIDLDDLTVEYLYKIGVDLGKHTEKINELLRRLDISQNIMATYLPGDLTSFIINY